MNKILVALALLLPGIQGFCDDRVSATVIEVVDAATMRVEYNGLEETLRLLGVESPESSSDGSDIDYNRRDADVARQRARDMVGTLVFPGNNISLEFDFEPRDMKNRLQAYVYLPDNSMLNYVIILSGFADTKAIPPNVKYASQFSWACQDAKSHRRGIWANRNNANWDAGTPREPQ